MKLSDAWSRGRIQAGRGAAGGGVTMADVAQFLDDHVGRASGADQGQLAGKYDFVVEWAQDPDSKLPEGVVDSDDPDQLSHWNVEALGFRRVSTQAAGGHAGGKDHIERPSEN